MRLVSKDCRLKTGVFMVGDLADTTVRTGHTQLSAAGCIHNEVLLVADAYSV